RYHDMMLGAMMQLAGDDTTVILMSDHGFHPDHLRPRVLPAEPAGPAAEHRHYGVFVAKGPGIPAGERVYGATVLDITPTVLHLMGLPVGADMDGKALTTVLQDVRPPEVIPSWEDVDGPCGMHPPEARESTADSAEAMKQLIELGYVEDLGEDAEAAVRQCVREQRYNLAQAYVDGGKYAEAVNLLDELWADWPEEHRFGMLLIECFGAMGDLARRREAVETFEQRAAKYGVEAREKLEAMRPELDAYREGGAKASEEMPKKMQADLRKLGSLAQPKQSVTRWLHATQALMEGSLDQALNLLEQLSTHGGEAPGFRVQLGSALAKAGRHADAMAEFERTLKGDPDHAGAHLGIATAALELGDVERAVEHALTSTELVYFQPRAHATLATALMRWNRITEAEAALGVAISQAPRLALAHEGLAT
ncbi:MAG: tetratricopeptide repeat protein, partial [Planctomycetota bacterium]